MNRPVTLPAIFSGVTSKADRSYKLTFNTRELSGEDAAILLGMHMSEGHLLFAPTDKLSEADIPDEPAKSGMSDKTPGQRRTFKLIKETPKTRAGALFQEQCDDGTQPYILITPEFNKGGRVSEQITHRELVEDQPKWFTEVFKVHPEYMTREELDAWEAFKKSTVKKLVARKAAPKRPLVRVRKTTK